MKKKLFVQTGRILSLLFLFSIGIHQPFFGQNEPEVVLEMKKGEKIKNVTDGKKVRIWYEGKKIKGYIDSIGAETIFIDGKDYAIDMIEKIGIKYKGTIITGSIVGTAGVLIGSFGTYMIIGGYKAGDLGGVLAVVFGTLFDIVSVPVIIVGGSVAFIGKTYKKDKGWEFKAVQIN
jgi:hypothetical protein